MKKIYFFLVAILCLMLSKHLVAQNVGVGTNSPDTKLHVMGDIKIEDGSQQAGYVLSSDANGKASWEDPNTLIDNDDDWTVNGNDIYNANSGNVGIGNTIPQALLHVAGSSATTEFTDQSSTTGTNTYGSATSSIWQSFTAGIDGELSGLDLLLSSNPGNLTKTIKIYLGEGTSGTLLYDGTSNPVTSSATTFSFPLSGISIAAGTEYTFELSSRAYIYSSTDDPYPGGRSSEVATPPAPNYYRDLNFTTYASRSSDGFLVSSNGVVTINDYVLPKNDGSANNVMYTDGNGNLTWGDINVFANDNDWSINGNNIYNANSGNVGIGTTTPEAALHIEVDASPQLLIEPISVAGDDGGILVRGARSNCSSCYIASIGFQNYDDHIGTSEYLGMITGMVTNATDNIGDLVFLSSIDGTALSESMRITSTGNVGIGTSGVGAKLDVRQDGTNADDGFQISRTNNDHWNFVMASNNNLQINNGYTTNAITISQTGSYVGINTTSPSAPLDVDGEFILGSGGSTMSSIVYASVSYNIPNINGNSNHYNNFTVSGARTGGSVIISPSQDFPESLVIGQAYVSSNNTVRVKFRTTAGSAVNPSNMNFYITVINP